MKFVSKFAITFCLLVISAGCLEETEIANSGLESESLSQHEDAIMPPIGEPEIGLEPEELSDESLLAADDFYFKSDSQSESVDSQRVYAQGILVVRLEDGGSSSRIIGISRDIGAEIVGKIESLNLFQLRIESATDERLQQLVDSVNEYKGVRGVTRDYFSARMGVYVNNDNELLPSSASSPYHLSRLNLAWELLGAYRYSSPLKVSVAILDSEVYADHLEFDGVSLTGDFVSPSEVPKDHHGTVVAGIIGARNNANDSSIVKIGMNGVLSGGDTEASNGNYSIISTSTSQGLVQSLYNLRTSADVVNISGGYFLKPSGGIIDTLLRRGVKGGIDKRAFEIIENDFLRAFSEYPETLYVVAAGNRQKTGHLPASEDVTPANIGGKLAHVLTVGGSNISGGIHFDSVQGGDVSIYAPFEGYYAPSIVNQSGESEYVANFAGTSASAPLVAGVGALLKSINPSLHSHDIAGLLTSTGKLIGSDSLGIDATTAVLCALLSRGYPLNRGDDLFAAYPELELLSPVLYHPLCGSLEKFKNPAVLGVVALNSGTSPLASSSGYRLYEQKGVLRQLAPFSGSAELASGGTRGTITANMNIGTIEASWNRPKFNSTGLFLRTFQKEYLIVYKSDSQIQIGTGAVGSEASIDFTLNLDYSGSAARVVFDDPQTGESLENELYTPLEGAAYFESIKLESSNLACNGADGARNSMFVGGLKSSLTNRAVNYNDSLTCTFAGPAALIEITREARVYSESGVAITGRTSGSATSQFLVTKLSGGFSVNSKSGRDYLQNIVR